MKATVNFELIRCFGNRLGVHNKDTGLVKLYAKVDEYNVPRPYKTYGRGFPIDHVRAMGEVTKIELTF